MIRLKAGIFEHDFEGPFVLGGAYLPDVSGVYVILKSNPFLGVLGISPDILYVGETGNLRERLSNHEKQACWYQAAGGLGVPLSVAYRVVTSDLVFLDSVRRKAIETDLIRQYLPPCNDQVP